MISMKKHISNTDHRTLNKWIKEISYISGKITAEEANPKGKILRRKWADLFYDLQKKSLVQTIVIKVDLAVSGNWLQLVVRKMNQK